MQFLSAFRELVVRVLRSRTVSMGTGRFLAIWRISLSCGVRGAWYATAGWISLLTAEAALKDPLVLLGVSAGTLIELSIEHGREWLDKFDAGESGESHADTDGSATKEHKFTAKKLNLKRAMAISLAFSAPLAHGVLLGWVSEHLDETIVSIIGFMVAGMVFGFLKFLSGPVWINIRHRSDITERVIAWAALALVLGWPLPLPLPKCQEH